MSTYYSKLFRLVFLVLLVFTLITDGNHESSVNIVFVFDTTASMGDVLRQLRQHALKILEHIETIEHNITSFNYILVPFNDPDIAPPIITNKKREFLMAMNDLKIFGGGDCPEPSITALKNGIEVGGNMSHVFLFTDADSKEGYISSELRNLIRKKKPSLYFIISGKCHPQFYDPIYDQLANISEGQYFNVHKSDVGDLLNKLESNLKPGVGKRSHAFVSQTQEEQQLPEIIFIQSPSVAFENDDILYNCSLLLSLSSLPHTVPPIKLTIYFNGQRMLVEKLIRNTQNGSIEYRINSVNGNQHNGKYKCVASRQSVASGNSIELDAATIGLKVENKNQVRSRTQTLPVLKGNKLSIPCPLDFQNNQNAVVGWQKNDEVIENPQMNILMLKPDEINALHKLKCFKIHKNQRLKDEILYNVIVGETPVLTAAALHDEFINKIVLSCDVVVKNLSTIQIFDGTMTRYIADSRDDNLDLHTEFMQYTREHHIFRVFLTLEQFLEHKQPFSCVIHSLFGSKQVLIGVDGIKTHTAKGTQNFTYATGTTSIMPNYNQKEVRVYKGNSLDLACTGYNHTQGHRGIVWVKENQPLPGFVTDKFSLNTITSQNAGLYRCFIDGKEVIRYNVVVVPQQRPVRHPTKLWSNWSDFSRCSVTCGTGFRTRTRKCLLLKSNCTESNFEVQICHKSLCANTTHVPVPHHTGPELVEWMGYGFDLYKDTEYNEKGIYHCMKGFTLDIFNKRCVDINECNIRNKCPRELKCVNTRGGYNCVTCPRGYMGINGRCLDINECSLRTHKCSHICINVRGSYRCDCKNGYKLHSDGISCKYQGFD